MKQIFTTQMDNTVKIITTIVHFAILPIPIVLYFKAGIELALLNVLILGVLFSLTYVLRPYQYVIDELGISVHKQLWPKKIPFHNIASIETIAYKELKVRLRLWGSGGLWGWFGFFLSAEYGTLNMQITEKNNLLLVTTKDEKYIVLSPTQVIAFAEAVKKGMKQNLQKQESK
jgi:hypothetical protein